MSAGERATLGALASDLLGRDEPTPRAAALGRVLAGTKRRALPLSALGDVPDWMRRSLADIELVGRRAALAAIAPALATSVDGAWLGGLARTAGEDMLDWARKRDGTMRLAAFPAQELDLVSASILHAAAPRALAEFAPRSVRIIDPGTARALVREAEAQAA